MKLLIRNGDLIPESDGWILTGLMSACYGSALSMNASGQIVVWASFTEGPTTAGGEVGWLRIDEYGNPRILVNGGSSIPGLTPPELSQTRFVSFLPTFIPTLNNHGDITVTTTITIAGTSVINLHIIANGLGPQCAADFNHDGQSSIEDLFAFLQPWFAQDARADFNHDNSVTVQDLFDFLAAWFAGCG